MKTFKLNKYTIYSFFLTSAAVDISYEHGDWVLVEYNRKFFPGKITHVINNQ